jgi:hypothetical protein
VAVTEGGFVYTIDLECGGKLVHRAPANLAVCLEDTLFRAVISGRLPNDGKIPPHLFTPVWNGGNPPAVAALELNLGNLPATRYEKDVVAPQARAMIQRLLKDGVLKLDDEVHWRVSADKAAVEVAPPPFSARVSRAPFPMEPVQYPDAVAGDFSVQFDDRVLSELSAEVAAADAVERAWLLVGSLGHDRSRAAAGLHVRGVIPVEVGRGGASQHHFAFDPAAFVAARRAALATEAGAIPLGWAHSHPPCIGCRKNPDCQADTRFFSLDDVQVHSSAFTNPFTVGLVVGKVSHQPATQLGFRLYGWQKAEICEREYRVSAN